VPCRAVPCHEEAGRWAHHCIAGGNSTSSGGLDGRRAGQSKHDPNEDHGASECTGCQTLRDIAGNVTSVIMKGGGKV